MGKLKTNINHTCHICGNNSFNRLFIWFDYSFNKRKTVYQIFKCKYCWLEEIYPTPTRKEQVSFYPSDYYSKHLSENKDTIKDKCIKFENILFSIFDKKELKLPEYDWNNTKNFLDIWCWDWKNLLIMKSRNRNAKWFEIDNNEYFKNNIYYAESITDVDFWEKFDVIRCNHVFEHIDNPVEFLAKVNKILKKDWKFIINLPNIAWLSWYIFWKYATERDIPRHLYWYNYNNIQKLFNNCWFKIINKHRWRQSWMVTSLAWYIIWKYNKDIRKLPILYFLLWFIFIPIEFIISIFKITNSMWFVLMKK